MPSATPPPPPSPAHQAPQAPSVRDRVAEIALEERLQNLQVQVQGDSARGRRAIVGRHREPAIALYPPYQNGNHHPRQILDDYEGVANDCVRVFRQGLRHLTQEEQDEAYLDIENVLQRLFVQLRLARDRHQ